MGGLRRIVAAASLLATVAADAGPFGYGMGQRIDGEPHGVTDGGMAHRTMPNPPRPFDAVIVYYTPQTGVCRILASLYVDGAHGDGDGARHRERAHFLARRIKAKRGEPTDAAGFLAADDVGAEDRRWLEGIMRGERHFLLRWRPARAYQDGIQAIEMHVLYGIVELDYTFSNIDQCSAAAQGRPPAASP